MYKKLVKYDEWHFAEVDPVRLKRTALALQEQIRQKVMKGSDPYRFYDLTMPVIEASISGEIHESLDDRFIEIISGNFKHDRGEGFLPPEYDREFSKAVAAFDVTVRGLPLDPPELTDKEGATYAWLDCEEEGDWPDKVKYR